MMITRIALEAFSPPLILASKDGEDEVIFHLARRLRTNDVRSPLRFVRDEVEHRIFPSDRCSITVENLKMTKYWLMIHRAPAVLV